MTAISLGICLFAPKLGSFEQESMVSNLYQAQTQLNTTRSAAENAKATSFEIQKELSSLAILLLFAQVLPYRPRYQMHRLMELSVEISEIAKLISLYQQNNSLKETVVVALGTNTTDNYQELLDQLVKDFPKGRRLIFVTPYDGNFTRANPFPIKPVNTRKNWLKI